jgi:hypothetical protein
VSLIKQRKPLDQCDLLIETPFSRNFAWVPFELDQREGENARRLEASGKEIKKYCVYAQLF